MSGRETTHCNVAQGNYGWLTRYVWAKGHRKYVFLATRSALLFASVIIHPNFLTCKDIRNHSTAPSL